MVSQWVYIGTAEVMKSTKVQTLGELRMRGTPEEGPSDYNFKSTECKIACDALLLTIPTCFPIYTSLYISLLDKMASCEV